MTKRSGYEQGWPGWEALKTLQRRGFASKALIHNVSKRVRMGQRHVTARVPEDLYEEIERIRESEQLDRSTAIKRLLERGIEDWRLETAIDRYRDGSISLGRATELAGVSLWRMLDTLDERGVELHYTGDDLEADIDAVRSN